MEVRVGEDQRQHSRCEPVTSNYQSRSSLEAYGQIGGNRVGWGKKAQWGLNKYTNRLSQAQGNAVEERRGAGRQPGRRKRQELGRDF